MYVENKIKFSILIKYYRFFLYGLGVVCIPNPEDSRAFKFS